jgi:hypothetical protein
LALLLAAPSRADEPARPFRAALVPRLSIGAAAERLPTGWIGLAWAGLTWPLEALRHDSAAMAAERRASGRRQSVAERMAELDRRRAILRARVRDAETQLDLEEAQAEADAVLDAGDRP